ncbi:MAG TPA: hypothetical protein VJ835_01805 [Fimbriimonadaceae bacterium]|nr:hypothetical protein [Fimbriimonadaceae bacterium]
MRAWSSLIRLVTVVAPLAILVFWGASYLIACAEYLANPGAPVKLNYRAPAGELTILADSYVIDTHNGDMKVVRPRVLSPAGIVLFSAERIEAEGLPLLGNETRRAIVSVKGAYGTIQRRKTGEFDLFDYLPKQEGPSGNFPYSVFVDRGRLKFVEATGPKSYVKNLWLTAVRVDGVGDRWVASGDATIVGVGDLALSIQNQPNAGVWIRGNSDQLELAELYRAFRLTREGSKTPVLMDLNADRITVTGPFEVLVPSKAGVKIQTTLTAEAEGFYYTRDYQAEKVRFKGLITADGAQGKLDATRPGLDAQFNGIARWVDGFQLGGDLDAFAQRTGALPQPIQRQIPREFALAGPLDFKGKVAYSKPTGLLLNGSTKVGSVRGFEEEVRSPSVDLDYGPDHLTLVARAGSWRNAPIQGHLAIDNRTRALSGFLKLSGLDLGGLARRFNVPRVTGKGNVDLVLSGTIDKPVGTFRSEGRTTFALTQNQMPRSGQIALAGTIRNGKLWFDQAYLVSSGLSVAANGTYDLNTRKLDVDAVGSGIDLDRINPELEGIARFKAAITGTLDNPLYRGSGELFGLVVQGQPIPIITGEFRGNKNSILATELKAVKGVSQAQGQVALTFKNMALNGTFKALGVQLSDFLGDDYLATIDLPDARLGGTFKNPTFNATATAREIVIKGNKVDSASAVVSYAKNLLQVDDFMAKVGDGKVDGFISYNVAKKGGEASFTAENLALQNFIPADLRTNLVAILNGEAGLTFGPNGFKSGSAEGTLKNVTANETPIGDGDWRVSSDGKVVTGDLFFGGLTSSVDLTGLRYEIDSKSVAGNVWLRNVPVQDVYKISRPYLPVLDQQLTNILEQTNGTLGLSADLSGTIEQLDFGNGGFTAENLKIGERPGGNIKASFERRDRAWTIANAHWAGGPLGLDASGSFTEAGALNLSGEIFDADLSYVSLYEPSFSSLTGRLNSAFVVKGTTQDPVVTATINSSTESGIGFKDAKGVVRNVFNLQTKNGPLSISNWKGGSGGLDGQVNVTYQGYDGQLDFKLPFQFPFNLVPGAPVDASFVLAERRIQDVEQLAGTFDPARSEGTVGGALKISGTKENLTTIGDLGLNAPRLVFRDGGQQYNDVKATLAFRPQNLAASILGKSDQGGSFEAQAQAGIPSLDDILRQFRAGTLEEELFASKVTGTATATNLMAKIPVGSDGSAGGTVSTQLNIGGTLKEPTITGNVDLARGFLNMPGEFNTSPTELVLPIQALFEVNLRTTSPAKFKSSTADIDMVGTGRIQGTLTDLDATAQLRVDKGQLRLPTARVNIEPGGSIRPNLSIRNGISDSRLDVELEGKTRVVASKIGVGAQRYDVTLDVRGDLLQEGGLNLTASSDPPDLSQNEILALLGQVNLLQGIASGVQSGNPESQIRDAFFGIAVPYLLDPLTSQIASAFGLDYLTLDINALDGATIYFAKTISRDLILQGSRQVSQVNQNYPIKYDLRLSYLLRFGSRGDRRRLTFNVGLDELRPWKIAVEYSFRF